MNFRIGIIDYLNTQPFQYQLEEKLTPKGVSFQKGVPTSLNHALLAGEIDLAPISAIFAAQHADQFLILPNHGIASLGAVKTVSLFSWHPDMQELDGATVALTNHSATSVALLNILCTQRYHIQPNFVTVPQHLPTMMQEADAALVIGDTALVEGYLHREIARDSFSYGRPTIFDLGDEWLKLTALPFTFAVWALRKDAVDRFIAQQIFTILTECKQAGLGKIDQIAADYAPRLALPPGVCGRYLRDLRYDLEPNDLQGLFTFLELASTTYELKTLDFFTPESEKSS